MIFKTGRGQHIHAAPCLFSPPLFADLLQRFKVLCRSKAGNVFKVPVKR